MTSIACSHHGCAATAARKPAGTMPSQPAAEAPEQPEHQPVQSRYWPRKKHRSVNQAGRKNFWPRLRGERQLERAEDQHEEQEAEAGRECVIGDAHGAALTWVSRVESLAGSRVGSWPARRLGDRSGHKRQRTRRRCRASQCQTARCTWNWRYSGCGCGFAVSTTVAGVMTIPADFEPAISIGGGSAGRRPA